jgi:hypothetical protein
MKYFLDTEFSESQGNIELISIGIVSETGEEFYAEVSDFDWSKTNDWVKKNVIPNLWHRQRDKSEYNKWSKQGGKGGLFPYKELKREVLLFIGDNKPEFWGYYADYDWVVFCWLFGAMIDLPKGWPMYCRDIKQLADELGVKELPKQKSTKHNALEDARWNKTAYEFLKSNVGEKCKNE